MFGYESDFGVSSIFSVACVLGVVPFAPFDVSVVDGAGKKLSGWRNVIENEIILMISSPSTSP